MNDPRQNQWPVDPEDDAAMDALAQLLDSYMEAQQDFLDQSGLTQA